MAAFISALSFLNPWILSALVTLPVLWLLLRILPPAPQIIFLPTARFLEGLVPEQKTPGRTPWWILLLRILIAALVILALAHPVLNEAKTLMQTSGPVRIVLDNGWNAANIWQQQRDTAREIIAQAGRADREIWLLTTAPEPDKNAEPLVLGPLEAGQALTRLDNLTPRPWAADYEELRDKVREAKTTGSTETHFLGAGLDGDGFENLARQLQSSGQMAYLRPEAEQLPILLRPLDEYSPLPGAFVSAAYGMPDNMRVTVQLLSGRGRIIDSQSVSLSDNRKERNIVFDTPPEMRGEISHIQIAGRAGAGAVYYFANAGAYRTVGVLSGAEQADSAPLTSSSYYLEQALSPYANLVTGTLTEVLAAKPGVIMLPDTGSLTAADLTALEEWVMAGGMLARFAGPNMADNRSEKYLLPVDIRPADRSLSGALTWDEPSAIAAFEETSPFFGISVPPDIRVNRQILANPSAELEDRTWARLEDGTPLVTAGPKGEGFLVFFHTSADAEWSDLALSGLYVQMLKRLLDISGNPAEAARPGGALQPLRVMDGFGRLAAPGPTVKPVPADALETLRPGPAHPPGIYGRGGYRAAFNLGDGDIRMRIAENPGTGISERSYDRNFETDLRPALLYLAAFLFVIDWIVMLALTSAGPFASFFRNTRGKAALPLVLLICLIFMPKAYASNDVTYASALYLAYIETGDPQVDATSRKGLENLAKVMTARTSAEPQGVVALEPESELFLFFPLVYWPVTADAQALSVNAQRNVQHYLDHGGTILFDTRDSHIARGNVSATRNAQALRRITASLDVPALAHIPDDHVLRRSFYLLKTMPGRYEGGTIWVEQSSAPGKDGVSSVIVGGHDWAYAWSAESVGGGATSPHLNNGTRQQEYSFRFGVNLLMYALTGNYKADQVHIPHILERLGQ